MLESRLKEYTGGMGHQVGRDQLHLAGWEEAGKKRVACANPPAIVAINIRPSFVRRCMNVIKMLEKFERHKPFGCARAPVVSHVDYSRVGKQDSVAMAWEHMLQCVEVEL